MEAGSSSNPFRRAKLPSSSFGSFGSLMPEGERIALEGLCNLMRSVAYPRFLRLTRSSIASSSSQEMTLGSKIVLNKP